MPPLATVLLGVDANPPAKGKESKSLPGATPTNSVINPEDELGGNQGGKRPPTHLFLSDTAYTLLVDKTAKLNQGTSVFIRREWPARP